MTVLEASQPVAAAGDLDWLLSIKGARRMAVCIPARNEATTIGTITATVQGLHALGLVDEVVVVDDGSTDKTAHRARAEGASVVSSAGGPGKGQALATAMASTDAQILVFLDADVTNFSARFVIDLAAPLLSDPSIQLVKATYRRPLDGVDDEGGRVTELLARPLLRRFVPDLATITQPLAGECALRRTALAELTLADGYGIEIGLLMDIYLRYGRAAIAEVDLGERVHRNRPLLDLRTHADDVLAAVVDRLDNLAWNRSDDQ
ncbi:MAG: glucosyl-3-phosphoglycerate synthase [Acidimicrobiia bacterium]